VLQGAEVGVCRSGPLRASLFGRLRTVVSAAAEGSREQDKEREGRRYLRSYAHHSCVSASHHGLQMHSQTIPSERLTLTY